MAKRFYRNTAAWLRCANARIPSSAHKHFPLCLCVWHTNMLLHESFWSSLIKNNKKHTFLTCLWCLPSFVKSQVLCLFFSQPLSLFCYPSRSLPLFLSPSLTLPSPLSPLVDKPACWVCSMASFPLKVTVVLSPPLLGSWPERFSLNSVWNTAGSFMCLNCVTVCYFVSSHQSSVFASCASCMVVRCFYIFEIYFLWTSVRESPDVIASLPRLSLPTPLLFRGLHTDPVMCFSLAASHHWLHGIFSVSVKCPGWVSFFSYLQQSCSWRSGRGLLLELSGSRAGWRYD